MKRILKLQWKIFFKHSMKLSLLLEPLLKTLKTAGTNLFESRSAHNADMIISYILQHVNIRPKGFVDCGDRQKLIYERVMFLVEQVKVNERGPPVTCLLQGPNGR